MVPSDQMLEEEIPPFNPESVASDVQRRHFTDFANDPELVVEPKSPDVPPQNPAFSPEAQPQAPDLSSAPISSNAKNLTPEPTLNPATPSITMWWVRRTGLRQLPRGPFRKHPPMPTTRCLFGAAPVLVKLTYCMQLAITHASSTRI